MSKKEKQKVEKFEHLPFLEEMQESGIPCSIQGFSRQIELHYNNEELRKDAILSIGESGVGKTQIVFQTAEKLGIDMIYLNLTASGKEDIVGWPLVKSKFPEYDGKDIQSMFKALLSGEKYYDMDLMELLKPLVDPTTKAIVLLDEVAQIPLDVQRAIFPIMQERRIGNQKISDGILIVGTMNPTNKSEYMLDKMQKAMQERFNVYVIKSNMGEWITYGLENGFSKDVISYVRKNPSVFMQANPRRLEKLSKIVNSMDMSKVDENQLFLSVQSVLGPGKAGDFITHVKTASKTALTAMKLLKGTYSIQDIDKAFTSAKNSFGVMFSRLQSDMYAILENPQGYDEVWGTKISAKNIKTAASGIMNLCTCLRDRNDFDLTIGVFKGVLSLSHESISGKLQEELSELIDKDETMVEQFLMAAGVKDHMININQKEI